MNLFTCKTWLITHLLYYFLPIDIIFDIRMINDNIGAELHQQFKPASSSNNKINVKTPPVILNTEQRRDDVHRNSFDTTALI